MKKLLSAALVVMVVATACEKTKNEEKAYEVNSTTSVANWKGSAPDHFHTGSFDVKGSMTANPNGEVKSGSFVIPIASIKNFDLPDEVKPELLNHLKSADFFNMALHPNAEFTITKIETYTGPAEGVVPGTNKLVTGNFTMNGQTHPLAIPAKINKVGDSLKVEGKFQVDRSKWGMTKYTDVEGDLYIIPQADIHLIMQAGIKK